MTQTFTLTVKLPPLILNATSTAFVFKHSNSFTISTVGFPNAVLSELGCCRRG